VIIEELVLSLVRIRKPHFYGRLLDTVSFGKSFTND